MWRKHFEIPGRNFFEYAVGVNKELRVAPTLKYAPRSMSTCANVLLENTIGK